MVMFSAGQSPVSAAEEMLAVDAKLIATDVFVI